MPFAPDDIVRIIAVEPGSMVESYLGCEGRVLSKHPGLPLYEIEIDAGRATPDRGGQLGPRFILKEAQLDPDVTPAMLTAAAETFAEYECTLPADGMTGVASMTEALATAIYRAMRAARFKR